MEVEKVRETGEASVTIVVEKPKVKTRLEKPEGLSVKGN